MTEANPQPSNESETRELLNIGVGTGHIKSKIARLKLAIGEGFLIRLSKLFHDEIQ